MAEKTESESGWVFPVGDEVAELGYVDMFSRHVRGHRDRAARRRETFYDGYVVNAVMDACFRSAAAHAWEPVELRLARRRPPRIAGDAAHEDGYVVIKEEHMPDGRRKLILKDPDSRRFSDRVVD